MAGTMKDTQKTIGGRIRDCYAWWPVVAGAEADGTPQLLRVDSDGHLQIDAEITAELSGVITALETVHADLGIIDGRVDELEGKIDLLRTTLHADLGTTLAGYLDEVETKLAALVTDMAKLDRKVASASIVSVTTANPGSGWSTLSSLACNAVELVNATGTSIDVRRGGAGNEFVMPTGTSKVFLGVANANEIGVKRTDDDNSQVTLYGEALVYA